MDIEDIERVGKVLSERTHLNRIFWLENNLFKTSDGKRVVKVITVRKIINRRRGTKYEGETTSVAVAVDNCGNFMEAFKKHVGMWADLDEVEITPSDVDVMVSKLRDKRASFELPEKYVKGKEREYKKVYSAKKENSIDDEQSAVNERAALESANDNKTKTERSWIRDLEKRVNKGGV